MRIEDLNCFLAVAETSHVGRAAERLGLSQPVVTKGIQRLEHELQLQLFERSTKGMTLTTTGAAFLHRARQVKTTLDGAIKEANDLQLGRKGIVRVGVSISYSEMFFAGACTLLVQQRPAARIKVTIGLQDQLLAALLHREIDIALSTLLSNAGSAFVQIPLFKDDLYAVAREDHPIHKTKSLSFTDLGQFGWVLPSRAVNIRRGVEARFEEHGMLLPNVIVETSSSALSRASVVKSTDLLTLLTESQLATQIGVGLKVVALREAMWPRVVGITMLREAHVSPLAERIIELMKVNNLNSA